MRNQLSHLLFLLVFLPFFAEAQPSTMLAMKDKPNEFIVQAAKSNVIPGKDKIYFENADEETGTNVTNNPMNAASLGGADAVSPQETTDSDPANEMSGSNQNIALTLSSFNVNKSGCGINLHWNLSDRDNIGSINIERSTDGNMFETISKLSSQVDPNYTYKDGNLKNGNFEYRIRIVKNDGSDVFSNTLSMNLNCNKKSNVLVFPNPAKDILNIQSTESIRLIKVFAASGQLMETKRCVPNSNMVLDVAEFTQGIYQLQVSTETGTNKNLQFIKE